MTNPCNQLSLNEAALMSSLYDMTMRVDFPPSNSRR